jgi:hypothetical protein
MKRKQVLVRMSVETYDRLQGLSEKYGLSASALIVSMVNDRWLAEKPGEVKEEIFRVDPVRYDREYLDVEAEKMGVPEEVEKSQWVKLVQLVWFSLVHVSGISVSDRRIGLTAAWAGCSDHRPGVPLSRIRVRQLP